MQLITHDSLYVFVSSLLVLTELLRRQNDMHSS